MEQKQISQTPAPLPAPTPKPEPSADEQLRGRGYLIVPVSTAGGAVPLAGARVDIRAYDAELGSDPATRGDVIASLVTDRDGKTPRVALPAPPREESETPNGKTPYAFYQAEVFLEGYYRQSYIAIPIFDGITAVQPAVLIPLPENGTVGKLRQTETRFFEGPFADR